MLKKERNVFRILIRTYLCVFPTLLFAVLFTCWMCVVSLHHYRWKLVRWNLVIRSSRRATTQSWIALVRLLNFVAAAAVATVRRFWFKEILSVHALTHRTVSKRRFLVNFTIDNNIVKLRSFLARSFNNSYLPRVIYDDANKSRFEQIRKKFFVFSSYYRCKKKALSARVALEKLDARRRWYRGRFRSFQDSKDNFRDKKKKKVDALPSGANFAREQDLSTLFRALSDIKCLTSHEAKRQRLMCALS